MQENKIKWLEKVVRNQERDIKGHLEKTRDFERRIALGQLVEKEVSYLQKDSESSNLSHRPDFIIKSRSSPFRVRNTQSPVIQKNADMGAQLSQSKDAKRLQGRKNCVNDHVDYSINIRKNSTGMRQIPQKKGSRKMSASRKETAMVTGGSLDADSKGSVDIISVPKNVFNTEQAASVQSRSSR